MGGLDPAKILMILLVAVIVLGPERLPKAARQLGAAWRELTRVRERLEEEVRSALPDLDLPSIPTIPRGGLTGYLTGMMTSVGSGGAEASGAMTGEVVSGASCRRGGAGRTEGGFSTSEWTSAPAVGAVAGHLVSLAQPRPGSRPVGSPPERPHPASPVARSSRVSRPWQPPGPFAAEVELLAGRAELELSLPSEDRPVIRTADEAVQLIDGSD